MNRRLITLILLFFTTSSFSQTLSASIKNEIWELGRAFFSAIELYSGPGGSYRDYNRIFNDFYNKNSNKIHAYDLFKENVLVGSEKNILGYLQDIESDYNNQIEVQVNDKDISVFDCIISNEGKNYAAVKAKKILKYKGITNSFEEIVFFNIDNSEEHYKVTEVKFSNNFQNPECIDNKRIADLIKEKFEQQLKQADFNFRNRNFTVAKSIYKDLLNKNMQTEYLNSQISKCDMSITLEAYLIKADQLYSDKKFEDALGFYQIIIKDYSNNDNSAVLQKIESCKIEINTAKFKKMVELADYYFNKGLYNNASQYYKNALSLVPNDTYVLAQMEKSKRGDPQIAGIEIRRAIALAESSNKNWGVAFKIMLEYEPSGLLNAENYYFIVMLLDGRDKRVKNEMGFKFRDFQNYLNIYAAKLRTASKRENYGKGFDLLNYILNKRNQN